MTAPVCTACQRAYATAHYCAGCLALIAEAAPPSHRELGEPEAVAVLARVRRCESVQGGLDKLTAAGVVLARRG